MLNEKLEKLEHEKYVAEKKLNVSKHKQKQLQSELKQLTRSQRTHRLCTRAGMLETFLREPTILYTVCDSALRSTESLLQ